MLLSECWLNIGQPCARIAHAFWRCGLRVREDQHCFTADSAGLLARAYAYRAQRSEALVIYADNTPVGMALYYDLDELHAYNLSQLFIDARY